MPGRFAPSPTGDLHLGNLRTALLAWLAARAGNDAFIVRIEDLDQRNASVDHERRQFHDLKALGIDWDGEPVRQSERLDRYRTVIEDLTAAGLTYPCFCSRREVREANRAPHADVASDRYAGTCRGLTAAERAERARRRPAALRLKTDHASVVFDDEVLGTVTAPIDDFVLQRNDGTPAYHVAVVVDDADQGITQVVRGDDLASSTPRHIQLQRLLGLPTPRYAHVPLVTGSTGERLAKRDGPVTLADLVARGIDAQAVLGALAVSIGLAAPRERVDASMLVERFEPHDLARYGGAPVPLTSLGLECEPLESPDRGH